MNQRLYIDTDIKQPSGSNVFSDELVTAICLKQADDDDDDDHHHHHHAEADGGVNPLRPELNSICYLLALLAHHFLHVSRIRVKSLTIKLLMSYIYGAPILDLSRSHTTTQHSR